MTGEVRSVDGRGCRGWARLPGVPDYPVVVHLLVDDVVCASAIADQECDDEKDPFFGEEGWFLLDVPEDMLDRRSDLRVLVGESGEFLYDPALETVYGLAEKKPPRQTSVPAGHRTIATYRDALALGLSAADVLDLLYLDILRRPADRAGSATNFTALESGKISFEGLRKALLCSPEYRRLRLKRGAAPGRIFAHPLVVRSSSRRQHFERHAGAFQRSTAPMAERLLRFFPGLLLRPSLLEQVNDAANRGLPAREVFCRALSHLSDQPALILPGLPGALAPNNWTMSDGEREVTVPSSSALFALGWHRAEGSGSAAFRWMTQIGVLLNPCPQREIKRIDVVVNGWYGGLDRAIATASERGRLALARHQLDDGSWVLSITGGEAGSKVDYVVLVAVEAICPYRYDGTPDPRVLSFNVTRAVFVFEEKAT